MNQSRWSRFLERLLCSAEPTASVVMMLSGMTLGAASAALQISVFSALIGGGWISTAIVLAFEAAKGSTAIAETGERHRRKTQALRGGLFIVSFMATLFYVSAQLTAPNLDAVIEEEIERIEAHYDERIEAVQEDFAPRIAERTAQMKAEEQDTFDDGTFAGPQYDEYARLRGELVAERDTRVQELEDQRDEEIDQVRRNPPSDRRVQNEQVASFIQVVDGTFGIPLTNAWVSLFTSGLVAALMELAIFKLFAEVGAMGRQARETREAREAARRRERRAAGLDEAGPAASETDGAEDEANDRDDHDAKGSAPGSHRSGREASSPRRNGTAGSSGRSGWLRKLRSKPWIFGLALLAVGLLELFTPVAPAQRLAGNAMNTLPPSALRFVMGEEDARRYLYLKRLVADQEQQGIMSTDGAWIARPTAQPAFPAVLQRALVQNENHRFWDRYAVDWWGTSRAAYVTARAALFSESGAGLEGGSGLTQQLAGGVVLENGELMRAGLGAGLAGKLWEATVSAGLADRFSRAEVLDLYMRTVYLGNDSGDAIQGFAEAAWAYFGRPAHELSEAQSVALVSILPGPNTIPKDEERYAARYATVVGSLCGRGVFTEAEGEALLQNRPPLHFRPSTSYRKAREATTHARRYQQARADSVASSDTTAADTLHSTISAAISVRAQTVLEDLIEEVKRRTGVSSLDGFVIVAEQGKLRAMIGSVSPNGYNRAIEQFAPWTPGSTMKPYTYAEFFAQGGMPADRLAVRSPRTFTLPSGEQWPVSNYSSRFDTHPPMRADRALAKSINTSAASLSVGPEGEALRTRLTEAGYADFVRVPSDALGGRVVQPLRHFRLLQSFVPPYGAAPRRFALAEGEAVEQQQIWPSAAGETTARAMRRAVAEGTLASGRRCCGWTPQTHWGKTGTGKNHKAASLFVAQSGGLTLLMGVYSPKGELMTYKGRPGGVAGGTLAPYADRILDTSTPE